MKYTNLEQYGLNPDEREYLAALAVDAAIPLFASLEIDGDAFKGADKGGGNKHSKGGEAAQAADRHKYGKIVKRSRQTEHATSDGAEVAVEAAEVEVQIIERVREYSTQCMERYHPVTGRWKADRIVYHYSAAKTADYDGFTSGLNQLYYNISAHFYISRSGRAIQLVDLDMAAYTQGPYLKDSAAHVVARERYLDGQEKRTAAIAAGTYSPPANPKDEFDPANPNYYCYSFECESTAGEAGDINEEQIQAVINITHYFKRHAIQNSVTLPFDREKDPENPDHIKYDHYDPGYNATYDVVTPYWADGHILGHYDLNATPCPGAKWPWERIMEALKIERDLDFLIWTRDYDKIKQDPVSPVDYRAILSKDVDQDPDLEIEYYRKDNSIV